MCVGDRGLGVAAEKSTSEGIPVPEFLSFFLLVAALSLWIFDPAKPEMSVGHGKRLAPTGRGRQGSVQAVMVILLVCGEQEGFWVAVGYLSFSLFMAEHSPGEWQQGLGMRMRPGLVLQLPRTQPCATAPKLPSPPWFVAVMIIIRVH